MSDDFYEIKYLDNRTSLGAKAQTRCQNGYVPISSSSTEEYICDSTGWLLKNNTNFRCIFNTVCKNLYLEVSSTKEFKIAFFFVAINLI